jgi:hypothetical protein
MDRGREAGLQTKGQREAGTRVEMVSDIPVGRFVRRGLP